jgi:hypothetical protein
MPFAPAQFPIRQPLMNGQTGRIYSRPQWPNMPSRETVFPMGPMANSMLCRAANGLDGYVRVPEPFVPGARGLGSVMDAVRRQPLMFGLAAVLVAFSGWGLWSVMRKKRKPARNSQRVRLWQQFDDDPPDEVDLEELIAVNEETLSADEIAEMRALLPGQSMRLGGGAQPIVTVRRMAVRRRPRRA